MPRRLTRFTTGEIYHIYNKSVGGTTIFNNTYSYQRMLNLIDYYRFADPPLRFSHYKRLSQESKKKFMKKLYDYSRLIDIYSYCLMPNHFHFLLKQLIDGGIPTYLRNVQNAYAKYFNTKFDRSGSLFKLMFRGVRIENDNQLVHVLRYIHLNPLTGYLISDKKDLYDYKWCSFSSYTGRTTRNFLGKEFMLKMFDRRKETLIQFTLNQVDYQRRLSRIKHLILDDK